MTPDTQALTHYCRHHGGPRGPEAADLIERLSGERAAIVAWLRAVDWCSESRSYANAFAEQIEQGLHHRAQALSDLAEGDAELIGGGE